MTIIELIGLVTLGLVAGVMAGMFGIGGGVLLVPAMCILFKYDTKMAIATSLAVFMVPFGLPAVLQYYRAGYVNVASVLLLIAGLFVGSFFGARITLSLPAVVINRAFGIFLLAVSFRYLSAK